ncbi:Rho GTPase-activating protein 39 [Leucoagaricus sp. SymC.cos]|nr:Rho GTPase-activating protein 39 [Leucoagaricus sp. SymC.cos]
MANTTTKPDEPVREHTTPPPASSTTLSPEAALHQPPTATATGKGKAPEQTFTPPSRSISRNSSRHPAQRSPQRSPGKEADEAAWGSNFWVTLVDPQTQTSFYACPSTGEVSWDPPVGHFVLPPNSQGEWWELSDESRGGIPYYYQTKTGETVWKRPDGFVIPLGIVQNTALGRRLSQSKYDRFSQSIPDALGIESREFTDEFGIRQTQSSRSSNGSSARRPVVRKSASGDPSNGGLRKLSPIPGSPYTTEHSIPPSPSSTHSKLRGSPKSSPRSNKDSVNGKPRSNGDVHFTDSLGRAQGASFTVRSQPQSLNAALELLASSDPDPKSTKRDSPTDTSCGTVSSYRQGSSMSNGNGLSTSKIAAKGISAPMPNHAATMEMSPVKRRALGQPIPVEHVRTAPTNDSTLSLSTGAYPMLPQDLQMDIQQFSESDYAKQYFSTHRSGFIFKRRVPVEQLMTWQKSPLTSPLLMLSRVLGKDAVRIFKVIQRIMGDREREIGFRLQQDTKVVATNLNASSTSLTPSLSGVLEEERWLIGEGLAHGELRDEIYCQLMKQLTRNPNPESVFKGWQFLCVLLISFPPSKDFETYLQGFIQQHTTQQEGRIDVIAKYCLRRLAAIAKKGPKGKPPTLAEIETASDAAFNPSTFGESLDAIIRLQLRNYPHKKVPIILPFLADGILALGGLRSEGIFRVPGDGDSVSELKLRIDRGYYTLDNVDDPYVLASLMKLWLRELCDPLIPDEMYNECIMNSNDPDLCVRIVERLPTINRRVVLFLVSFLQLFLEDKTQNITKMTPANLALVMAPNLLRCSSDSMSVVFTNAQYEQLFVYHLLLHLKCNEVDPHYKPTHGLVAVSETRPRATSRSRDRRR